MAARAGRFFGRFFGRTIGDAASFAIGGSISRTIDPVLQQVENEAWAAAVAAGVTKPITAATLASGVAQGQVAYTFAVAEAARSGFTKDRFDHLVDIANTGPGVPAAFDLWRRGVIDEAAFRRAARRQGIESEWIDDLVKVKQELLDPAVVATMVQRGILPNDGILPVGPPTATGQVPPMPGVDLDPHVEAAGSGIDADRLAAMARIVGLPASPDLAARMVYRGIVDRVDFDRAISEGNTRNEWAPFLFDGFRQIPTAHDGIEYHLRGWGDQADMYAQTARHGMSQEDTDRLFTVSGRPLSFHQVWVGLARGGVYDGPTDQIEPAFLKSLRESNIRPEWYSLAWAQRYSYPSAFVLRALAQSGDLTQAETEQILLFEAWEPTLAAKVSAKWAAGTGAAVSTPTKAYVTAAVKEVSKSYIEGFLPKAEAETNLSSLGVTAADQTALFGVWDITRAVRSKELTASQIRAAVGVTIDYFTAAQQLEAEGYTAAQVLELLGPAPTDAGQPPVGP